MRPRYFGLKNRLYASVSGESAWLDVGPVRFHLRWKSAEDGRTWDWHFHWFKRDWTYR